MYLHHYTKPYKCFQVLPFEYNNGTIYIYLCYLYRHVYCAIGVIKYAKTIRLV